MSRRSISIGLALSFLALLLLPITKTAAQAATATVTPTRTATPAACNPPPPTYFASVVPSATSVNTGDQITVRVTTNVGIASFSLAVIDTATGLVQSQTNPIFNPAVPASQTPTSGVNNVQWTLTAVRAGTVFFRGGASGEVRACQGGQIVFTFGAASGQSGNVTVGGSPVNTFTPTRTPTATNTQTGLSAEFTGSPLQSNSAPLLVNFSAPGAAGAKCTWTWGDGGVYTPEGTCSATTNHLYRNPGSYTVSLHVDGAPNDVTKPNYIVVLNGPTKTPTCACFTITPTRTPPTLPAHTYTPPAPTRTPTPTTGITNTPTRTPTRTLTPSVSKTPTRTPTRTNTPVVGACSPVTSTIAVPFTFDGAGTFCWQAGSLGGFINSWNTTSVTLNGVNVTNIYVASGSYPAKINGFYYVGYSSSVAWGHFEAKP